MGEKEASHDLVGQKVVDVHGDKVGTIQAILIREGEERSNWARVKADPLGVRSSLVPLHDAQDDDGDVRLVYEREHVAAAPEVDPDGNELTDEQADELHHHYGLERLTGAATAADEDFELPRETRDKRGEAGGEDPSGPIT